MSLRKDGVEFKQLDDGQGHERPVCGCGMGDVGEPLNPGCISVALLLTGRRAGQSRAERSGARPPRPGQWRGRGLGAETGGRAGGPWAQEVELEAEAEAVVVLGPRSVLLPSVDRERR